VDWNVSTRRWPGAAGGLVWVGIWLFPLALYVGSATTTVVVVGVAAFGVCYTVVTWSAFEWPGDHPLRTVGFLVVAGLGLVLALAAGPEWLTVLLYVASCGVAVFGGRRDPGRAVAVVVGTEAALITVGLVKQADPATVAWTAGSTLLASGLVYAVGQLRRLIRELRDAREAVAVAAVAEERLRFARDLHDLLGQSLSIVVVKAEAVRRLVERDPAAAIAQATDIEDVGRRALVEIREAVTGYRDSDLITELARAQQALTAAGIAVTIRHHEGILPAPTDGLLAWVVREATTNVIRHSGASRCEIAIATDPAQATVDIRDDGHAAVTPAVGNGLRGLTERVAAVGGSLTAGPQAVGFVVSAVVPLGALLARPS
jgi:two-component system sensor histidine kinase DesK